MKDVAAQPLGPTEGFIDYRDGSVILPEKVEVPLASGGCVVVQDSSNYLRSKLRATMAHTWGRPSGSGVHWYRTSTSSGISSGTRGESSSSLCFLSTRSLPVDDRVAEDFCGRDVLTREPVEEPPSPPPQQRKFLASFRSETSHRLPQNFKAEEVRRPRSSARCCSSTPPAQVPS